jgi:hypothetical protein
MSMAKTKSSISGKATRASKSQSNVNDPANIPSETPVEQQQVNPSVQVAASTSATEPQVVSDPIKTEVSNKSNGDISASDKAVKADGNNKMFEVRKTEPRKNVVPINIEDEIRRRAYELSQQRAPGTGGEADDWFMAEREVMQRYHQHSA